MKLKKLGLALFVVCALGVVMASSAFAAATTEDVTWRTGAAGTVLTGSETVSSTGSGKLITTVGETPLVLNATGLNCSGCTISNEGGTTAVGAGKLEFTGVTVEKPAGCAVKGNTGVVGTVPTLALKVKADYMEGSTNYILFEPNSGSTFTTLTLLAGSGSCPLSGNYIVSGKVFVKSNNATGVYAVGQTVTSSGAINSLAGGSLKFGSAAAELNGTGTFSLSGAKKGEVFGTK